MLLLLYVFEPTLITHQAYSNRHWQFVQESLTDLNSQLKPHQSEIKIAFGEAETVFYKIQNSFEIKTVFSYQETGVLETFKRDLKLKNYFETHAIKWLEYQNNGVERLRKNRVD